jgi:hypothetical protein
MVRTCINFNPCINCFSLVINLIVLENYAKHIHDLESNKLGSQLCKRLTFMFHCVCINSVLCYFRIRVLVHRTFCPCCLPESLMTDCVTLDSLEEVEIYFFTGLDEVLELIELLSDKALILIREIVIRYEPSNASLLSKEVRKKVRLMCHTNIKVEFTMLQCHKRLS